MVDVWCTDECDVGDDSDLSTLEAVLFLIQASY